MPIAKLRADLAFIRTLILMHCKVISQFKQAERETMAAIDALESGAVAAAVARAGEQQWQWDGRCQN